jgi:AbrB family looped-hinge helix DNA binding protein
MKTLSVRRPLGARGQVVVPKDIREFLNLRPGGTVLFVVHDGEVAIKAGSAGENFVSEFLDTPKTKHNMSTPEIKRMLLEEQDRGIR